MTRLTCPTPNWPKPDNGLRMTCHDFHGNHMATKYTMAKRLRESEVRDYFEGGLDPYGNEKRYNVKNED